ncbi:MAG: hypothetical protein M3P38_11900 [Chloroflexota bacterium]|nr:hypothetical protein [Chloroflexota bacterium]
MRALSQAELRRRGARTTRFAFERRIDASPRTDRDDLEAGGGDAVDDAKLTAADASHPGQFTFARLTEVGI